MCSLFFKCRTAYPCSPKLISKSVLSQIIPTKQLPFEVNWCHAARKTSIIEIFPNQLYIVYLDDTKLF